MHKRIKLGLYILKSNNKNKDKNENENEEEKIE